MEWAAKHHRTVLRGYFFVAVVALVAHLTLSAEAASVRFTMAAVAIFFALFGYFGMRLIIGIQVKLHAMKPFIRAYCTFGFYFFAVGSLWTLATASAHPELAAVGVVGGLGWSLGALMTYVKYRGVASKWTSNLTTG